MHLRCYHRVAAMVTLALLAGSAAGAQTALSSVEVTKRHDELAKLKEALADPDPLSRLASMEAAVASGDATAINLAIRIAFASDDPQMRGLAMRVWVASLKHLTVDVVLPDEVRKEVDKALYQSDKKGGETEQPRWLQVWTGRSLEVSFIFSDGDVAKGSGSVITTPICCNNKPVEFTISGSQLVMSLPVTFPGGIVPECHFRIEPASNLTLTGSVACQFNFPSPKLPIAGPMF